MSDTQNSKVHSEENNCSNPTTEKYEWGCAPQKIKVPPNITWQFWVVKSCCTTVGETVSDQFNSGFNLGLEGCAAIFYPIMIVGLLIQFNLDRYYRGLYWFNVVIMSICGTIATDGLYDNEGINDWIQFLMWGFCTICSFALWYKVEGTIDIHSINTFRREAFYWITVIFTFALGTAVGDGISGAAGLGYGPTFGLFVGIISFCFACWYFKLISEVASFWLMYVLTRPLGAALGDCLASPQTGYLKHIPIETSVATVLASIYPSSVPTSRPSLQSGGAGLGYGYTSVLFMGFIGIMLIWAHLSDYDLNYEIVASSAVPDQDVEMVSSADVDKPMTKVHEAATAGVGEI